MRLEGPDGSLVQLSVIGYEFPALETEEYDSNWLLVRIRVVHPRGQWNAVSPCLLTYELKDLADWFDSIARGQAVKTEADFLEPNLSFRLGSGGLAGPMLRLPFDLESRPPWAAP